MTTLVVAGAAPVGAWPGDPDPGFGSCGTQSANASSGTTSSGASAAEVQPNGRVVVAGYHGTKALVARFLPSGAPDTSFADRAYAVVAPSTTKSAVLNGVAVGADGAVVASGSHVASTSAPANGLVVKLGSTGALDPAFGAGTGMVVTDNGGGDYYTSAAVQPDGGVLAGGTSGTQGGVVVRYTSSGALDASFGEAGRRANLPMTVDALLLAADGRIVVGGRAPGAEGDFVVARLTAAGALDPTFDGDGIRQEDVGGSDGVSALAFGPADSIFAAGPGRGASGQAHTVVRRYAADGSADAGFALVDQRFGVDDQPLALRVLDGGRVLVGVNSGVNGDNDMVVARLTASGALDESFGIAGATVIDAGRSAQLRSIVVVEDGRPLVVGTVRSSTRASVGLVRLQPEGATDPHPALGLVLDGWGGLHGFSVACTGKPPAAVQSPYWTGWDITRGVAALPGGRALVVDGWGGVHAFAIGDGSTTGLTARGGPYWTGWDIVRGVATLPEATGGYVLDGFGGLHPFALGSAAPPARPTGGAYWRGIDMARGVALLPDGGGGYVVDRSGGLHPFGGAPPATAPSPSWPGWDIARGVSILPDGSGGYIADAWGGLHPFGIGGNPAPPAVTGGPYWPGWGIVRGVALLP